ncbi:hypothetical protein V6N12_061297 [Hibiscus sabdariffa]|uniref:Uncharacterized protein n=1 Tax=Hibiscus sabdariffa TaxID=183260 RepID=A0ABR2DWM8_9ROSI
MLTSQLNTSEKNHLLHGGSRVVNTQFKATHESASPKLSGSLSTNKQNKSLIASVERYKSLTLLNLRGLLLELSPELELSLKVSSWIGAGEGGGVMFCGRSTTCGGITSCSSTKYEKKS